jgi:hypothetical protein
MASDVVVLIKSQGADKVGQDIRHIGDTAERSSGPIGRLAGALGDVAKIAAGFVIGQGLMQLPGLVGGMIGSASDLEESLSKVGVVFGENAGAIDEWARRAAQNMGISRGEALAAAGAFGNLFTTLGLGAEDTKTMSMDIVQLAADLASFNNIAGSDALEKLRAGLVGEAEPLRALGVNINAAAVEAKALEMGLVDANGEVSEAAKVQARYALILEQTTTAQGDFARTSDGHANQMRILKARFADMRAEIGERLLPGIVAIGGAFLDVLPSVERFVRDGLERIEPAVRAGLQWLQETGVPWFRDEAVPAIEGFADAVAPVFEEIGRIVQEEVMPALEGIAGAIRDNWPQIRSTVESAVEAIGEQLRKFGSWYESDLKPAFENIKTGVTEVVGFFRDHWSQIEPIVRPVIDQVVLIIQTVATTVRDVIGLVVDLIQGDWSGAWENAKQIVETAKNFFTGTLDNFISHLQGLGSLIWDAAKALGEKVLGGLQAGIEALLGTVKEFAKQKALEIGDGFAGLIGRLTDIGKRLMEGLISGIESMVQWVKDKIAGIASGIVDGFKSAFGIGSPSRRMAEEVGEPIAEGIIAGIESRAQDIAETARQVVQDIFGATQEEIDEWVRRANASVGLVTTPGGLPTSQGREGFGGVVINGQAAQGRYWVGPNGVVEEVPEGTYDPQGAGGRGMWYWGGAWRMERPPTAPGADGAVIDRGGVDRVLELEEWRRRNPGMSDEAYWAMQGVPGLARGTRYVPRDGLAYLHRGEAVVPATANNGGEAVPIIVNIDGQRLFEILLSRAGRRLLV